MWHDSFICATWLIHMCDMTHSYVWHDSLVIENVSFIIHITTSSLIICTTPVRESWDMPLMRHLLVYTAYHIGTWGHDKGRRAYLMCLYDRHMTSVWYRQIGIRTRLIAHCLIPHCLIAHVFFWSLMYCFPSCIVLRVTPLPHVLFWESSMYRIERHATCLRPHASRQVA